MSNPQFRNFCFTINNYAPTTEQSLKDHLQCVCKYIVWGREVGEEGTPHLQGFAMLKKPYRFKRLKKLFADKVGCNPHIEKTRGTPIQAADYCKKDGHVYEHGTPPKGKGKRTDIDDFLAAVREGEDDDILADQWPAQFARYYKAADRLRRCLKEKESKEALKARYADSDLRPWQTLVLKKLCEQDDRKVTWVYDPEGNIGKSFLANYMVAKGDTFLIEGGRRADVAHAYNYEGFVVFDFTRSQEEVVNYSLIESFKNGRIFSGKYQSALKIFDPPAVLCLSNFDPDRSKLSQDRWQVLQFPYAHLKKRARPSLERQDCCLEPPKKRRRLTSSEPIENRLRRGPPELTAAEQRRLDKLEIDD